MQNDKRPSAMWYFLKRYKNIYLTLLLVTVAYAVLESVNISVLLPLFDTVLNKQGHPGKIFAVIDAVISHMPFKQPFMNVFLLAISLVVLREITGYIRVRLMGYGVGKIVCDVKEEIFKKFTESDYQFFLDNKQGKLIYDLLTASSKLGSCLQFFPDLVTSVLMTLTVGSLLFAISAKMTILLMIVGSVYSIIMHFLAQKVSYNIGTERARVSTEANVLANELIDGVKHIKVSGSFDIWRNNFNAATRRFKELVIQDYMWNSIPDRMIQILPIVILTGIAFFLYARADAVEFLTKNLVTMGVYIYAFYRLNPYLASFGRLRMQIMGALPDVEILYDNIHKKTSSIKDGDRDIKDFTREIRFNGVNFAYKGNAEVLRDVNTVIEKGKTTAIVGASGSGKTTLINLLVRLFDPDRGRITIDGVDLKEIRHSSLIHLIGMVSQDTFIFNGTIKDNIVFGLKDTSEEQLIAASKLANAHSFIESFPAGYETIVGDKGLKLSGGQRQRIAIARAILRDPKILILDEATSSLDYHSEVIVQQAINTVSKNRTVVVIAHRLSTVINADKIIVLDRFRVAEEGTHGQLMEKNGVYRSLYESQGKAPMSNPEAYMIQNKEIRFEVTNKCNSRCIMCPREKMTRPQGVLDLGFYLRVLDEAYEMGARVVSLENYGETFLDPYFFERAAYAKAKGMQVYTITNGSLFNKEMTDKAIYFIDKIRFSIYGTTKEVYESIHKGLKYETVISNLEYLIERKKVLSKKTPKTEVYFLLMEQNKHQMEDFKRRWMGVVDDIAIWKPHNWSDGRQFRPLDDNQRKVSCGRPAKGPVQVQWDGLVVPCCFDYNSSIVLGDLNKQTLRDILESKEYNKLREAHSKGDYSAFPFCDTCDQLRKREDVLVFTTIKQAKVGSVNTTYEKVG